MPPTANFSPALLLKLSIYIMTDTISPRLLNKTSTREKATTSAFNIYFYRPCLLLTIHLHNPCSYKHTHETLLMLIKINFEMGKGSISKLVNFIK